MTHDDLARSINMLFLSLHYAVEECVAGRFSLTDLEATRDKVFSEYQVKLRQETKGDWIQVDAKRVFRT